ncbi:DnaB-like helicase N-terminal domain-containing protein [Hydrogenimonas thermophila]|uniref:Replicative DNA helicase n=1 Tax=Hydrogenimonas thermophila TaxID=223786 RepID=A0A1I5M0F4_9BACT|nr:DnaB-like helicase N-terminal domain-containing protein [Hydrogenimonas thermophila]SFP02506.1 replicative DNA helicase [Hydrogenimonas thermophila]
MKNIAKNCKKINEIDVDTISNLNIERAVLSTIIFDPVRYEEIAVQLKPEDFYHPFHQHLFVAMEELFKGDQPIDEEFLREKLTQKNQFDEVAFLDIVAYTNPLSNANAYIKEIKAKAQKRKLLDVTTTTKKMVADGNKPGDIAANIMQQIDEISKEIDVEVVQKKIEYMQSKNKKIEKLNQLLQSQFLKLDEEKIILNEIEKLKKEIGLDEAQKWDDNIDDWLDRFDLDPDELENIEVEYLVDNLIVKQEISMIFAPAGTGKSLGAVDIANMSLINEKVERALYFDLDNGDATLAERKIHDLKKQHGKKFRYFRSGTDDVWRVIREISKRDLTNSLIVFDSAKNFMQGKDRDKNKDVSQLTEIFKRLRDKGATVIFLHHSRKPPADQNKFDQIYSGSSAWEEDTSNSFLLINNPHKNTFIFVPQKNRIGKIEEQAFQHKDNHTLQKVELQWAKEDELYEKIRDEIIDFIDTSKNKPTFSQILTHLMEMGFSKNKSNEVIQSGKGRYWKVEKVKKNNKSLFFIIEPETAETKFEIIEFEADNTDKSDKSYFRDFSKSDNCGQVRITANKSKNYVSEQNDYSKIDIPVPI